jgi:DNA topoisomerase-1
MATKTTKTTKKQLVIVESPTKAKTISRFLGSTYMVKASFGHVRDLPKSDIGVDLEGGTFLPHYVVPTKARAIVTELKKIAKTAEKIYFATDEDREGEAISWHLRQLLGVAPEKTSRITFHEITEKAITNALEHPRDIDDAQVDAQQARRILDRLVGYELSPFLWHKVRRGLSAGRVQSVAVRLIVEREREIMAFRKEEYWSIEALFATEKKEEIPATLQSISGAALEKFSLRTSNDAEKVATDMRAATWKIGRVERKNVHRSPAAPYTTSTLQQDANRKLGMSAKQTMMVAQQLYEGVELPGEGSVGLITYMRTDSVNLADSFVEGARTWVESTFGKKHLTEQPRRYTAKSKLAQEAHEAIRPTEATRTPESLKNTLEGAQWKLYDLIWRRAVSSQMENATMEATTVDIVGGDFSCRANGSVIVFPGFLAVATETQKEDTLLPVLTEGETLTAKHIEPKQHFTEPPPRYSDASIVKVMEEYGIGRPSTYAPTISTVIDRGYVERIENRRLKPTETAFLVTDLLVEHFPGIVDYAFTAKMEDDLDLVAEGKTPWVPMVKTFYHPFHETLVEKEKTLDKKKITEEATDIVCEKCGKPMVIKMGRFGKFLACTGYPECKTTKPLNKEGAVVEPVLTEERCEKCQKQMAIVEGRYGKYLKCTGAPECDGKKPIEKKLGVSCPQCKTGDMIEKRSKRGKTFYACNRYPDCAFALWSKPTGDPCPTCGSLLVLAAKGKIRCSKKECDYVTEQE